MEERDYSAAEVLFGGVFSAEALSFKRTKTSKNR